MSFRPHLDLDSTCYLNNGWSNGLYGIPPYFGLDKLLALKRHLYLLLHVRDCTEYFCTLPNCAIIKFVVTHMKTCTDGKWCGVKHCVSSKQIEWHWSCCVKIYADCALIEHFPQLEDYFDNNIYDPQLWALTLPNDLRTCLGAQLRNSVVNQFISYLKIPFNQSMAVMTARAKSDEEFAFGIANSLDDYISQINRKLREFQTSAETLNTIDIGQTRDRLFNLALNDACTQTEGAQQWGGKRRVEPNTCPVYNCTDSHCPFINKKRRMLVPPEFSANNISASTSAGTLTDLQKLMTERKKYLDLKALEFGAGVSHGMDKELNNTRVLSLPLPLLPSPKPWISRYLPVRSLTH